MLMFSFSPHAPFSASFSLCMREIFAAISTGYRHTNTHSQRNYTLHSFIPIPYCKHKTALYGERERENERKEKEIALYT